ncbi:hypothetical protein D3C78_1903180 [compost metagenome]
MIPTDFRYVNQAVYSANIYKRTEWSKTLNSSFELLAFRKLTHYLKFISFKLLVKHFFLRQNNFIILTIQFLHFNS